eukprot:5849124-Pyramimonas_sp.AAC.1
MEPAPRMNDRAFGPHSLTLASNKRAEWGLARSSSDASAHGPPEDALGVKGAEAEAGDEHGVHLGAEAHAA